MAALPSDVFFPLPYRMGGSKKTEFSQLNKYIQTTHGKKHNVASTIEKMTDLRKAITTMCANNNNTAVPNEAFVETTLKQYIKLIAMAQGHVPLHSGNIPKLVFAWKNAWDESVEVKSDNANLEMISLVYNMGAAYAHVARMEIQINGGTPEAVKNAFKYFQMAAGVYEYAATLVQRLPSEDFSSDLSADALQLCQKIAITQAHHCSYLKAIVDMKGKTSILSKIAIEASNQYQQTADTARALGNIAKTAAGASLIGMCDAYVQLFVARAHLLHGNDKLASEDIGDAMGRFNFALEAVSNAERLAAASSDRNFINTIGHLRHHVTELHGKAVHENETVHFERATKSFPPLDALGKCMGKATPCPSLTTFKVEPGEPKETDPFHGIVPSHVAETVSSMQENMRAQVKQISDQVTQHRSRIRENVNALGMVAAVESLSGEEKTKGRVPETLRMKLLNMQQSNNGESLVRSLMAMIAHTTQLSAAVSENIDAIRTLMREESEEDMLYRGTYGEKLWGELRKPSAQLPDVLTLKKLIIEYQETVAREVTAPSNEVKTALEANLRELSRLDWPMEDLDALMPYMKSKAAQETNQVVVAAVERLKKLLARFDQIEDVEATKLKELRDLCGGEDLTMQLSSVSEDQQDIVKESVTTEFNDRIAVITSTMSSAETVLEEAVEQMTQLAEIRSTDPIADEIQKVCNSLETAMNLYKDLHQRLSNIATSATSISEQSENAVSIAQSYKEGRHLEAEDFKTTLEQQVAAKVKEMNSASQGSGGSTSESRQAELQRQIDVLEEKRRQNAAAAAAAQQQPQQQYAYQPQPSAPPPAPTQPQQQPAYYAPPTEPPPPAYTPATAAPTQPYVHHPQQQAPYVHQGVPAGAHVPPPQHMDQYNQNYQQAQLNSIFGQQQQPAAPANTGAAPSYSYDATASIPPPPSFAPPK